MNSRDYSPLDRLLIGVDQAVRTVFGRPQVTERSNPANGLHDPPLEDAEREESARLMRINHTGEVCAQALYQGQAVTARNEAVRDKLQQAAMEENDHLVWTETRLKELGERTSLLNPLWYGGSFLIGATTGMLGDKWSLGFLAETEHQVVNHLQGHLQRLPQGDHRSRAILRQMQEDEAQHKTTALHAGGRELPAAVKKLMGLTSRIMTGTAYRI